MLRTALTGGIATGKSYCLGRFEALGAPTIDADRLARLAVAPGSPGLAAVVERFGPSILRGDGTLDRSALAAIIFSDRSARAELEAIIHPDVYRRIREWFARLAPATPAGIADIPLLFETGHEHDFDVVVVAACPPDEQVRRLSSRSGLGPADARARIDAQWPIEEKVRRANYVIRTSGSFEETDEQVRAVYRALLESTGA